MLVEGKTPFSPVKPIGDPVENEHLQCEVIEPKTLSPIKLQEEGVASGEIYGTVVQCYIVTFLYDYAAIVTKNLDAENKVRQSMLFQPNSGLPFSTTLVSFSHHTGLLCHSYTTLLYSTPHSHTPIILYHTSHFHTPAILHIPIPMILCHTPHSHTPVSYSILPYSCAILHTPILFNITSNRANNLFEILISLLSMT